MKYVITYILIFSFGVVGAAASSSQGADEFAREIGLGEDGSLVHRDHVATLLHRHLPEGSSVTLDDLSVLLARLPEQEAPRLLGPLVKRSKEKEMGTRAQLMLRLLDNIKSLTDEDLDNMRTQLGQKDRDHQVALEEKDTHHEQILSQKNIENWASMAITAAITGLLAWALGANC